MHHTSPQAFSMGVRHSTDENQRLTRLFEQPDVVGNHVQHRPRRHGKDAKVKTRMPCLVPRRFKSLCSSQKRSENLAGDSLSKPIITRAANGFLAGSENYMAQDMNKFVIKATAPKRRET